MVSRVAVLMAVAAVGLLSASGVSGAVPKCDTAITGKLASFYPGGIPQNIIASIKGNGLYSYVVVSTSETTVFSLRARCLGIKMQDDDTVQVTYKLSLLPQIQLNFDVREINGVLIQTDGQENKLYVLYLSDGVILTYRCCDDCTATGVNVGIAVADKLKTTAATKTALAAAKQRLKDLGLDGDVATMSNCT